MMFQTKDITFTNLARAERLADSTAQLYDLIIIGGGITGAGIAIDAALRGLKTLLVEKNDFASGTSSKSTKLIHGGLRYLKQLEFGLVKETGLERAVAHNNIPHLVHPEKMLLPIVEGGTFGKISASLAISVYDLLAQVTSEDRMKSFDKEESIALEPIINQDILHSSVQYSEYRTDDARLTVELIKASRREGAEAFNYVEVEDFLYAADRVCGVKCVDRISGESINFSARQVVSAAGPWVDELRSTNNSKKGKGLQLTKGVHIVLDKEKLPVQSAVYFDAFDGRMLFAIPRGRVTYVGTSDTSYSRDKDNVLCTSSDVEYILKALNNMFNVPEIVPADIVSTWAGLRPLIQEEGKSNSELSRKDEIFISDSDLISIAGGKLTGFRKMAQRIVDLVIKRNDELIENKCITEEHKIHADSFLDYEAYEAYVSELEVEFSDYGLSPYDAWYLATTYGKNARSILISASAMKLEKEQAIIAAEIAFCIQYESCYKPDDYFNRRSGRLYFDVTSLKKHMNFIIKTFSEHFNWDSEKASNMSALSNKYLEEVTVIKEA